MRQEKTFLKGLKESITQNNFTPPLVATALWNLKKGCFAIKGKPLISIAFDKNFTEKKSENLGHDQYNFDPLF